MSFLFSTKGIVLSRRDFKEADRSYTILTAEHGKIDCLARGGHKPLAKLTPHLETAAEVELLIVQGRAFQTIAGVERIQRFLEPRATFIQMLLVQNSLALVDLATRVHERDPALYEMVHTWLQFLQTLAQVSDERAAFLLCSFSLKLMALCGYRPELATCLACKNAIGARAFRWHALKGGVVCDECVRANEVHWFSARNLDHETLKLLRFSLHEPFMQQLRLHLRAEHLGRFHEILESYLISHFPTIPAVSLRGACVWS